MIYKQEGREVFAGMIKFGDNIRFSLDHESLFEMLIRRFTDAEASKFKAPCFVTDPLTGTSERETVVFTFVGFFKDRLDCRLDVPNAREYIKYGKGKPYVLSFKTDEFYPD